LFPHTQKANQRFAGVFPKYLISFGQISPLKKGAGRKLKSFFYYKRERERESRVTRQKKKEERKEKKARAQQESGAGAKTHSGRTRLLLFSFFFFLFSFVSLIAGMLSYRGEWVKGVLGIA